jgi:hypothetical protein
MIRQRIKSLKPYQACTVIIERAGGFYKARFEGKSECTFGETSSEATQKLRSMTLQQMRPRSKDV